MTPSKGHPEVSLQATEYTCELEVSQSGRIGLNIRYNFGIRKKEESSNIFNIDSPEKSN